MKSGKFRSLQLLAVAVISVAMLAGCSSVKNLFSGKSKDKSAEPAKLTDITPLVTASPLWSVSVGKGEKDLGIGQHPTINGDHVYAAAVDGGVSAIDLTTGKSLWHYDSKAHLSGGPGVGSGLVVVGGLKGEVIALDEATGQEKWTAKVNNEVLVAPAIGSGMVFVHSNDGRVTAFDASNGTRRWFYSADIPALTVRGSGGMTLGPNILFVSGDNGTLTALNANDGNLMWSTAVAEPDGRTELERMADPEAHRQQPALQQDLLAEVPMMCVVPKGLLPPYKLREGSLQLADLADVPVINLDAQDPVGVLVSQLSRESGVGLHSFVTVQTYHTALAMAHHGLGVAIVDACTTLSANPERVDVLPLAPALRVPVNALRLTGRPNSVLVKAITRELQKVVAAL